MNARVAARRRPSVIGNIVRQHAEEAAALHAVRTGLLHAPHARLRDLARFDERIVAHLDGLAVAGEHAWKYCDAGLEPPLPGAVFTLAVRAIQEKDLERLRRLFALVEAAPDLTSGLTSAFGWLDKDDLQGIVATLLRSDAAFRRFVGLTVCSMHRVDPGLERHPWLNDPMPTIRSRSLRIVGEIGCRALFSSLGTISKGDDPESQMWAAWSAVLLGHRGRALEVLEGVALTPNAQQRWRALTLAIQAADDAQAHAMLQELAKSPAAQQRWLIQGSGAAGNPGYVAWLINLMGNDDVARVAGEAFSLITGADLADQHLERERPQDFESGPSDNPDDPNVDIDPDEGLSWPDPDRVGAWWAKNSGRFQPGTRYFMGQPVTREHCIDVLKNGYQRQRILAAHYLCLLDPGTPLFNTSAPAWRQQKLLATMK